jgi:hypothetical protein
MDNYNSLDDIENTVIKLELCESSNLSDMGYKIVHEDISGYGLIRLLNITSALVLALAMCYYLYVNNVDEMVVDGYWYRYLYTVTIC